MSIDRLVIMLSWVGSGQKSLTRGSTSDQILYPLSFMLRWTPFIRLATRQLHWKYHLHRKMARFTIGVERVNQSLPARTDRDARRSTSLSGRS